MLRCLFSAPKGHRKIARGFQPLGPECERGPGAGSPWLLTIAPVGARKPRNIKKRQRVSAVPSRVGETHRFSRAVGFAACGLSGEARKWSIPEPSTHDAAAQTEGVKCKSVGKRYRSVTQG